MLSLMHVITCDNSDEAEDAVRDILRMYVEMAQNGRGFFHNSDVFIRFDPLKFIDAVPDDRPYHYCDLDLLRAGCAIAILCDLYNDWDMGESAAGSPYRAAVEGGKLAAFPDIESVARQGLLLDSGPELDRWLEPALAPIYRKYVLGYFSRLAVSDRSRPHALNVLAAIRRLLPARSRRRARSGP